MEGEENGFGGKFRLSSHCRQLTPTRHLPLTFNSQLTTQSLTMIFTNINDKKRKSSLKRYYLCQIYGRLYA